MTPALEGSPPVISASGIVHRYGERRALDGFSLDVPRGSVFGLLGPNGSGKSTFISLLAAMEPPGEGSLTVFGQAPGRQLRAKVGTVFQENAQDPLMRAGEHLTLAGRLFGLPRGTVTRQSAELLRTFGLAERARDPISTLSGGMRRRLDMARALMHDPELLLLDEPTTGVDPDERQALWGALLGRERGERTILLATNDLAEADRVCDAVAFMRDGRVVVSGTPEALKAGLRREAVRVTWREGAAAERAQVEAMPGVGVLSFAEDTLHVTVDDAAAFIPRLFATGGRAIRAVSVEAASLEDAYFQHVARRASAPEVVA